MWRHGIAEEERKEFENLADKGRKEYFANVESLRIFENELRAQIYELQFGE